MINQRFVVQLGHRTVGIAVRVPGGLIFYASDDEFDAMDGRIFTRARAIERELKMVAKLQERARRLQRESPLPACGASRSTFFQPGVKTNGTSCPA